MFGASLCYAGPQQLGGPEAKGLQQCPLPRRGQNDLDEASAPHWPESRCGPVPVGCLTLGSARGGTGIS